MKKFIKSNFTNRNNGDSKNLDIGENLDFNEFVDYSALGIFKMNTDTNIEYANQALAQILNYKSRTDLIGINFQNDLISESNDWERIRSKLYQQRVAKNFIIPLKKIDGTTIPARIDIRSSTDENGTPLFFEGSVIDISEIVASNPSTKENNIIEMVQKVKAPINSIVGFFTLIEKGLFNSEDELKDFSRRARQSTNTLLGIVDEINNKTTQYKAEEKKEDKAEFDKNADAPVQEITNEKIVEAPRETDKKEKESAEKLVKNISSSSGSQNTGKKILLVEDNPISQNVEMKLLKESGYTVVAVTSGEDAVKAVKTNEFSLVLMDVEMPDMDGIKATKVIRELDSPTNKIPIIAVTAHSSMKDRERCLSSGMNDYIAKPININFMKMTIDQWLKKEI